MSEKKGNAIAVTYDVNALLDEIVKSRSDSGNLVKQKKSIVAELIIKAHKRECK